MSYRYLITGILHGTIVGIGLSVGTYLSNMSVGLPFLKTGLGVAAGLVIAGFISFQEIQRTHKALQQRHARGNYSYLFETSIEHPEMAGGSQMIAGLSPLLGMTVTLFPFALQGALLTQFTATLGAVILGTAFLFAFGTWLGSATHRRWFIVGTRLAAFGLLAAAVNIVLP